MKYCCAYAYHCPSTQRVRCYAHDRLTSCCDQEALHECLPDMYGAEDGLHFGDGFTCYRCGNYELVGSRHDPPAPGFPRKTGPGRRSWLGDPPPADDDG